MEENIEEANDRLTKPVMEMVLDNGGTSPGNSSSKLSRETKALIKK